MRRGSHRRALVGVIRYSHCTINPVSILNTTLLSIMLMVPRMVLYQGFRYRILSMNICVKRSCQSCSMLALDSSRFVGNSLCNECRLSHGVLDKKHGLLGQCQVLQDVRLQDKGALSHGGLGLSLFRFWGFKLICSESVARSCGLRRYVAGSSKTTAQQGAGV